MRCPIWAKNRSIHEAHRVRTSTARQIREPMAHAARAAGRTALRGTTGATGRWPVSEGRDLKAEPRRPQVRQRFVAAVARKRRQRRPAARVRDMDVGSCAREGRETGSLIRCLAGLCNSLGERCKGGRCCATVVGCDRGIGCLSDAARRRPLWTAVHRGPTGERRLDKTKKPCPERQRCDEPTYHQDTVRVGLD